MLPHITQLTCPIAHRRGWTPAVCHHWRRRRHRNRHDGAYYHLRQQQHCHAAGSSLMSRRTSGLVCPLGVAAGGDVGSRTAQPPPPLSVLPPPHSLPPYLFPASLASPLKALTKTRANLGNPVYLVMARFSSIWKCALFQSPDPCSAIQAFHPILRGRSS